MKKTFTLILFMLMGGLFFIQISQAYAKDKELTLIYSGETHAMLYHCACPVEPDGGVARRATLIKQLRKQHPESLLLDSGNFFGAGLLDQNTQNTQLDMLRTAIALRAMELMQYDALNLSDDEFNFGKDFLMDNINKVKLNYLSANLKSDKVAPYIIKQVAGVQLGIIGVTNLMSRQKAGDLVFIEPKAAVESAILELKKKGVDLVILLSNLGEVEDLKIIESVPGIAVVIDGHGPVKPEAFLKAGNTVILRPTWQGRKLGKATLSIKGNKITNVSAENIRLSDKISDDPGILSILPRCFLDSDCKKEGFTASCQNAGSSSANCLFSEPAKVNLTVITAKECSACNLEPGIDFLKRHFPSLNISYIHYPDKQAVKLVQDLKITGLPAYLLDKGIAKDKSFDNLKNSLEEKGNFYALKPEVGGVAYFLKRNKIEGKLDLFMSLFDKDTAMLLDVVKEFNPAVHFLAIVQNGQVDTLRGSVEAEEDLRAVCVQKYYPKAFWDYITCRAKNINSTWWDDCALNMDKKEIKSCSKGGQGVDLLKENSSLNKELKIMFGPTYLLDNREIFVSNGAPKKDELRKILKK